MTTPAPPPQSSITLIRHYGGDRKVAPDNIYVEYADAVLDYISNLDTARHVRMDTRCTVSNTDEIAVTPDINARVTESERDSSVQIVIYSDSQPVSALKAWITKIHRDYVYEKANHLGSQTYYFNEVPTEPPKVLDMNTKQETYRMEQAPKTLLFTMNEFHTNKSFDNVYGTHVDELRERLDLFTNHPEWYAERGIPHSLGILLHGLPGAGKTSTIKAIAHDTNRHIFNLSLRSYTTQKQLTNLFYNETVTVQMDAATTQTYRIPLKRRVYVIEDIDCLTDVVLDREAYPREEKAGDAITLSFLLNLLDGVLETPGRILVITSNYPERLDRALIRPGRIDVSIRFGKADRALILSMINHFYGVTLNLEDIPTELDEVFTPAEVMESLSVHFKSPIAALVALVKRANQPSAFVREMLKSVDIFPTSAPASVVNMDDALSEISSVGGEPVSHITGPPAPVTAEGPPAPEEVGKQVNNLTDLPIKLYVYDPDIRDLYEAQNTGPRDDDLLASRRNDLSHMNYGIPDDGFAPF